MAPISLVGKELMKDGEVCGKIVGMVTTIHERLCTIHDECPGSYAGGCPGPTVRVQWKNRAHARKECMYQLLRCEGYTLNM